MRELVGRRLTVVGATLVAVGIVLHSSSPVAAAPRSSAAPGPSAACRDVGEWTPLEQRIWAQLCRGDGVDLTREPDRKVRGDFLRDILTRDPWRQRLPAAGVTVIGADVVGDLLVKVLNTAPIHFEDGTFSGQVDLTGVTIGGPLRLRHIRFGGPLYLSQVRVINFLDLRESTFDKGLFLNGVRVDGNLFLRDVRAEADGQKAVAPAPTAAADGDVEIQLQSAKIGGTLYLDGSNIQALQAQNSKIDQDLVLSGATIGTLNLVGTRIGGVLRASVANDRRLTVTKLNLALAHVGNAVFEEAQISGSLTAPYVTIQQSFEIVGGSLGGLDLEAATIGGDLILCSNADGGPQGMLVWAPDAVGVFDNAAIGSIQIVGAEWPPRLSLAGIEFKKTRNGGTAKRHAAGHCATPSGVTSYDDWFDRGRDFFSPQPYAQLALVLAEHGEEAEARDTLYRKEFDEWHTEWTSCKSSPSFDARVSACGQSVWGLFLWAFIGFGHHLERILVPIAAMLALGMVVLRYSGEAKRLKLGCGFWYSFDLLLPLVRLDESHYTHTLSQRPTYYFYFHRLMGFVLGTFLIAGLQTLAK